jgi:hypothetical protein
MVLGADNDIDGALSYPMAAWPRSGAGIAAGDAQVGPQFRPGRAVRAVAALSCAGFWPGWAPRRRPPRRPAAGTSRRPTQAPGCG